MGDDTLATVLGVKEVMADLCAGIAEGHLELIRSSSTDLGALVTKTAEVQVDFELTHRTDSDDVGARVGVTTNFWPEVGLSKTQTQDVQSSRAKITLQIVHVATDVKPPGDGGMTGPVPGPGSKGAGGLFERAKKDFDQIYKSRDRQRMKDLLKGASDQIDPHRDPEEDPKARGRRWVNSGAYRAAQDALAKGHSMADVKRDLEIALGLAAQRPDQPPDDVKLRAAAVATQKLHDMSRAKTAAEAKKIAHEANQLIAHEASHASLQGSAYAYAAAAAFEDTAEALDFMPLAQELNGLHGALSVIGGIH